MSKLAKLALLLFLSVFIGTVAEAQNTQLAGTMTGPDGSAFNGYLKLALEQQGASITPSCSAYGAPSQVLPNLTVSIQISNSAMVNPPKVWGADCLQPHDIPYLVTVQDIYGNTLYKDEWLIQGTTFDIGTAVSVYNPTIYLGITQIAGPVSTVTGPVTFVGAGVSQVGNTFTFTGPSGSVTWPTSGSLVLSNGTNTPNGLAPVNGDCAVGVGGVWATSSCSGASSIGVEFDLSTGVAATPANLYRVAPHSGTISSCSFTTTTSDATTSLVFNIKFNGSNILSGPSCTISNGTVAKTITSCSLATSPTTITSGQLWEIDVTAGTSTWTGVVQCY